MLKYFVFLGTALILAGCQSSQTPHPPLGFMNGATFEGYMTTAGGQRKLWHIKSPFEDTVASAKRELRPELGWRLKSVMTDVDVTFYMPDDPKRREIVVVLVNGRSDVHGSLAPNSVGKETTIATQGL